MSAGTDGVVIVSYPGRLRRFRGGVVTGRDGRIIHTFTENGTLRPRRPWRLWTCPVDCFVRGGGGGGGAKSPGKDGNTVVKTITPTNAINVVIGRGGAPGYSGGSGGGSAFVHGGGNGTAR